MTNHEDNFWEKVFSIMNSKEIKVDFKNLDMTKRNRILLPCQHLFRVLFAANIKYIPEKLWEELCQDVILKTAHIFIQS